MHQQVRVAAYRRSEMCVSLVRQPEMASVIPVSYTHLDVYKRQEYLRQCDLAGFELGLEAPVALPVKAAVHIQRTAKQPVSYTHLDVYKRQQQSGAIRGYSSAGRALAWHARGQRFDPAYLHQ